MNSDPKGSAGTAEQPSKKTILRRRAGFHLFCNAVDFAFMLAMMTWGFGLQVHNWWALVFIGCLGRWVFYILNGAVMFQTAKERAEEGGA